MLTNCDCLIDRTEFVRLRRLRLVNQFYQIELMRPQRLNPRV
jgi:hypothetical protein